MRVMADARPADVKSRVGGAVAGLAAFLCASQPALAELNKYEASQTGEFNVGTALQYGGTNADKEDFSNRDLRRSNFTNASLKKANFTNAKLQGAYFIKVTAAGTNFTGANLSDVLFDRSVVVEADFTDAVVNRTIFTLTDFRDAIIDGADFSDSLLDKPQQQALCKYAKGTNPVTGVSTRKSLGCGRGRSGTPSAYMTDDRSEKPEASFSPSDFNSGNQQSAGSMASSPY